MFTAPVYNLRLTDNRAIRNDFAPQQLPTGSLTHILYAFADINPDTGEVFLSDPLADTGSLSATSKTLNGYLQQLYLLKKQNRSLKVLLSIGGQTYSSHFASPASNLSGRSTFALSVVSLVENLGLDGVDIDWEYPDNASQAADMVLLVKAVSEALAPSHYTVSVACPGPFGYTYLLPAEMDQYVDFWNLMAYDYTGPWSNVSGDLANLFPSSDLPASTPFDTESIVHHYTSQGIAASKITLGMPLYGRYFHSAAGLDHPLGHPFSGTGTYDFKDLSSGGTSVVYDSLTASSYSYDAASGELVSYDTVEVARQKAAWIKANGLGGAMFWEGSADATGNRSMIQNVAAILARGNCSLDSTPNHLSYPNSTYQNVADNMSDSSSASTTALSSSRIISTVPATSRTTTLRDTSSLKGSSIVSPVSIATALASAHPTCSRDTCDTYKHIACPAGLCTCGLDANRDPVCVLNSECEHVSTCSTNSDCCPADDTHCETTCLVESCCGEEGHCAQLTDGCLDSPLTSVPSPTPHLCQRLFGGGGIC